jgi:hypothetical protein
MRSRRELIATACHALANHMESGDIHLSRNDAIDRKAKVRKLDAEQLKDVAELREIATMVSEADDGDEEGIVI